MTSSLIPILPSAKIFDQFFDDFFGHYDRMHHCASSDSHPRYKQWVDEQSGKLNFAFALAGYPKDKLKVEASGSSLVIKGEKVDEDLGFAARAFTETFKDSQNYWDFESSEVEYINGILKIIIPPKQQIEVKLLEIK